jgi:cytochrome oxidase Cu insertion factor (SCO1/SenC/PrrC family)
MVNSLTRQIGIAYYLNNEETSDNYLVDHSASIFLFDPKARMVGKFSPPQETEKIINQFKNIRQFIDAQ